MVRDKKRKVASKAIPDFKRRKHKVGKKLTRNANDFDPTFKTKSLLVPLQASIERAGDGDGGGDAPRSRISVDDALAHLRHHHYGMRRDALGALKAMWAAPEAGVLPKLAAVLAAVAPLVTDEDASVRRAAVALWSHVAGGVPRQLLPADALQPFSRLLFAFVTSGLTSIRPEVRLDALAMVAVLARGYPGVVRASGCDLAHTVASLLPASHHGLVTRSITPSVLPSRLGVAHSKPAAGAGASHAPTSKTPKLSSLDARLCVALVMGDVLRAMVTAPVAAAADLAPTTTRLAWTLEAPLTTCAVVRHTSRVAPSPAASVAIAAPTAVVVPGVARKQRRHGKRAAAAPTVAAEALAAKPAGQWAQLEADVAFGALFDVWQDCTPAEAHDAGVSGVARLTEVLTVINLLYRALFTHGSPVALFPDKHDVPVERSKLFTRLRNHVVPHFPFKSSSISGAAAALTAALTELNVACCRLFLVCLPPPGEGLPGWSSEFLPAMCGFTASFMGSGAAANAAPFLPAMLGVLQDVLPVVDAARRSALLDALTTLYSRSHKSSAIRRRCIACMSALLAPHSSDVVPADVRKGWLASYPKALWQLGTEHGDTSAAMVSALFDFASQVDGDADVGATLAQQCVPLMYATRRSPAGTQASYGPLLWFEASTQGALLATLEYFGSVPPLLARACCAVACHDAASPQLSVDVFDTLFRLLGADGGDTVANTVLAVATLDDTPLTGTKDGAWPPSPGSPPHMQALHAVTQALLRCSLPAARQAVATLWAGLAASPLSDARAEAWHASVYSVVAVAIARLVAAVGSDVPTPAGVTEALPGAMVRLVEADDKAGVGALLSAFPACFADLVAVAKADTLAATGDGSSPASKAAFKATSDALAGLLSWEAADVKAAAVESASGLAALKAVLPSSSDGVDGVVLAGAVALRAAVDVFLSV